MARKHRSGVGALWHRRAVDQARVASPISHSVGGLRKWGPLWDLKCPALKIARRAPQTLRRDLRGLTVSPAGAHTALHAQIDRAATALTRILCDLLEADKTVVASIRLAGGCEGSHDLVDAGFKLGDRERFLKKRKWGRVLTHRLIIIDAPPLCIHRDLRPVRAAMQAGRNKTRRPTHGNLGCLG